MCLSEHQRSAYLNKRVTDNETASFIVSSSTDNNFTSHKQTGPSEMQSLNQS
jgi:hypothetical protein